MAQQKLDSILQNHVVVDGGDSKNKLHGAAFVVVDKDGVLYQGGAGRIDLPANSPAFTPDSFTWTASMTKIITTTSIMQLVERGMIELDGDMRQLVPELAKMQILRGFDEEGKPILEDNKAPITLRHLLTHTVGLGYDIADPDLRRWSNAVGRKTTNLTFTLEGWNTPIKFAPGEGWFYGTALDWAAQALRKVTGQSLEEYMKENIFAPLRMADTTFHPLSVGDRMKDRVVASTQRDPSSGELTTIALPVPLEPPAESGGAGLHSTALDHARVLQALLKASSDSTETTLLRKETVDEMFRPQLNETQRRMLKTITDISREGMAPEFPEGTPLDHGISGLINLDDVPGKRRKGSMSWLGMANSHWWIDRETGIGASLMVNILSGADPVVNQLYNELETALYENLPELIQQ